MFHKSSISIIEAMQRLAGERLKYAVSNDKSKNAGYMGVSHYILRFVYSFLYILLLISFTLSSLLLSYFESNSFATSKSFPLSANFK